MRIVTLIDRNGQVVVILALAIIILIMITGLALDSGIAFAVRAKLNAAVDAATLAAGRSLGKGGNDATRIANARDVAERFFDANFPAGYLRATPSEPTIAIEHITEGEDVGSWLINVSATATVPTFFMRIAGRETLTTSAAAEAIRRDLDLVLILDTSGSLGDSISPPGTFNKLKEASKSFIDNFIDGPGGDRVGLVSFASGAVTDVPINKDATRGFNKAVVKNAIDALGASGATASGEAMRRALAEINAVPISVRSGLRVIVFFSDGAPNIVAGDFNDDGSIRRGDLYSETSTSACSSGPPCRMFRHDRRTSSRTIVDVNELPVTDYTGTVQLEHYANKRVPPIAPPPGAPNSNTKCNLNKAARNMVENVANTARGPEDNNIFVYTLGLGARLNSLEITFCTYGPEEHGANILRRLANTNDSDTYNNQQPSGLYVFAENASELKEAFDTIASHILRITR